MRWCHSQLCKLAETLYKIKKIKDNETLQIPPEKLKLLNEMVYSDSQKVIGRSLRVCECDLAKTVKRIQKKYQVEVEGYTLQKTKL